MSCPTQYIEVPKSIFLSCTTQYFLVAQLSVWFTSKNTFREKSLTENIKSPAVFSSISTRLVWVFKNYHVPTNKLAIGINWFANINIFRMSWENNFFKLWNSIFLICATQYFWVAQLNICELHNSIFLSCASQYFWVAKLNIFE